MPRERSDVISLAGSSSAVTQPSPAQAAQGNLGRDGIEQDAQGPNEKTRCSADAELIERLAACNFEGPEYDRFEWEMVRYGYQVIGAWIRSGHIFARCAERRIKGLPGAEDATWSEEDAEELVQDTVAHALANFQKNALRGGGWRPAGGASLTTYFVGACLFSFAEVYRSYRRRRRRLGEADAMAWRELRPDVPDVAETVAVRQAVAEFLAAIPDPRLRLAVSLDVIGYTKAEIAGILADGTTSRAVEGMLYRYRKQIARGEEGGGPDK